MFGWLRKLHGQVKVRFEGVLCGGREVVGTMVGTGYLSSEIEVVTDIATHALVDKGWVLERLRIVGLYGTTTNQDLVITGKWFAITSTLPKASPITDTPVAHTKETVR